MLDSKLTQVADFPRDFAVLLKHLLLSHHGQYEYGSPKRPKTLEAIILNYLDDLDSKINGIQTHIQKEPDNDESWTGYHRIYDRYFYKSPSAAIEQSAPDESVSSPPVEPYTTTVESASGGSPVKERRQPDGRRKNFNFTLGDQLRGKNLDLFTSDERDDK
jgi:3'-5' exoribonuclease